eukprot:2062502-Ditylum_brightwellii.AAC.1
MYKSYLKDGFMTGCLLFEKKDDGYTAFSNLTVAQRKSFDAKGCLLAVKLSLYEDEKVTRPVYAVLLLDIKNNFFVDLLCVGGIPVLDVVDDDADVGTAATVDIGDDIPESHVVPWRQKWQRE